MLFTNSSEQVVDESTDKPPGVVNPGYELGYDLKPCVDVNSLNSLHQGLVHIWEMTVVKPQSQQPEKRHIPHNAD